MPGENEVEYPTQKLSQAGITRREADRRSANQVTYEQALDRYQHGEKPESGLELDQTQQWSESGGTERFQLALFLPIKMGWSYSARYLGNQTRSMKKARSKKIEDGH